MTEKAAFGAGCFWGVEESFRNLPGVTHTAVGYMGGNTDHPTYKEVCCGKTNHAEVVFIEFDPTIIGYDMLLDHFWLCHDPTQKNRQGPDVGTQYRSVIFTYSDSQRELAEHSRTNLERSGKYGQKPIVTDIEPAPTFYMAEDYHQKYLAKRGMNSCHI